MGLFMKKIKKDESKAKKAKKIKEEVKEVVKETLEETPEEAAVKTSSFKASDFSTLSVPQSSQWQEYGTPQFAGKTSQQIRGILTDEGLI